MIDAKTTELVNGAIDGVLTDAEQREFDALLKSSAEARSCYEEIGRVDTLLKKLPEAELPSDLHASITAAVELPAAPKASALPAPTGIWRYGIAASVALLIAAGFYQSGLLGGAQDIEQMSGTIAPHRGNIIDSLSLDEPGLTGNVGLVYRDAGVMLEVHFESDEPVDLTIDLSRSGLSYNPQTQTRSALTSFSTSGQTLRAHGLSRQRFTVNLDRMPNGPDDGIVRLEYTRDGALIKEGALSTK